MGVTLIQSITASGSASTIQFSSIPQTYDHLLILTSAVNVAGALTDSLKIRVAENNDTYNQSTNILFNGSTTVVGNTASEIRVFGPASSNTYYSNFRATAEWFIPNYTNTARGKAIFFKGGSQHGSIGGSIFIYGAGFYNNITAVANIWLRSDSSTWTNTSIFNLYGIK